MDKLTFYDDSQNHILVEVESFYSTQQKPGFLEWRLVGIIGSECYQYVEKKQLFNLNLDLVVSNSVKNFQSELSINVELILNSDCVHFLSKYTDGSISAIDYLKLLNHQQANHTLLFAENWLLLSAKQSCDEEERGYRTLWDYLSPTALAQAAENGVEDPTTDAFVSFFKDWTSSHLSTEVEQAASELFKNLETTFTEFSNTNLADIEKIFNDLKQEVESQWQLSTLKTTLLEQVLHFFTTEDWQYTKLQGEPTLAMIFQGEHGQWKCYAKIREEQHQFVFYSVYPTNISPEHLPPISEFLTRANYGMVLGNFELDLDDGEIRYKTSISVEGDRLTSALIKNLVYTNVLTMDRYLPGIRAVLEGVSAIAAIQQVEAPEVFASEIAPTIN